MEGMIDFSAEVYGLLEKLPSIQSLPEKPAAEQLVAALKEKLHREPGKLRMLSTALNQILLQICHSDGDAVTVEPVPQVFLQRVESILEGYDDLIHGFNSFLGVRNPKKSETVIDQDFVAGFMEKVRNCGEFVYKPFTEIQRQYKLGKLMRSDELFIKNHVTFYYYSDLEEESARIPPASGATETPFSHHPGSTGINAVKKSSREAVQLDKKKRKIRDEEVELEKRGGKKRKLKMKRAPVEVEEGNVETELKTEGAAAENLEAKNSSEEENFDARTLKLKEQALRFIGEVKQRLSSFMRYKEFLEQFSNYRNEMIQRAEFESRILDLLGNHSDLMSDFHLLMKNSESDSIWCTPSYQFLSEDRPEHLPIGTTELEREVLNDCLVSVPCNEVSSQSRQYSKHEKMMFKYEDDRYEKDMMVGWFVSAIQFAEKKLKLSSSQDAEEAEDAEDAEDAEVPGELWLRRCVEQLYGDHAYEVIRMIDKEPEKTLPVVKKRLEEKLEEMKPLVQ